MKTVVSMQDLADFEIRPSRLVAEFQARTRASVAAMIAAGPLADAACQACGETASERAFDKLGLDYRRCCRCGTLYVSPRPGASALAAYARGSEAALFWREHVVRETRTMRIEKLVRPRAEWVLDALAEHLPGAAAGLDVSPQGTQLLAELAAQSPTLRQLTAAHVAADLDDEGTVPVVRVRPVDAPPLGPASSVDFVTAFDALDRAPDVRVLAAAMHAVLRPGGLCFVTAPSISGFDLQVLWEQSATIMPPDKLNLLSIDGFSRLFAPPAWQILELSTPGMFDVENVRQAVADAPGAAWPRVIRELVMQHDDRARLELQEYLQRHRLASFARLAVRRH
jgi:SAM-dependent methyltransferase